MVQIGGVQQMRPTNGSNESDSSLRSHRKASSWIVAALTGTYGSFWEPWVICSEWRGVKTTRKKNFRWMNLSDVTMNDVNCEVVVCCVDTYRPGFFFSTSVSPVSFFSLGWFFGFVLTVLWMCLLRCSRCFPPSGHISIVTVWKPADTWRMSVVGESPVM